MARPSGMTGVALPPGVRAERIETLWKRVDGNKVRFVVFTTLFILITSMLTTVVVSVVAMVMTACALAEVQVIGPAAIGYMSGAALVLSLVATTVWSIVRLGHSETWLLKRLGARITAKGEFAGVKSVFKDITIAAGFEHSPPLYFIETDRVNAFALGRTPERAAVGITRGFVDRLTHDQQRAVFANLVARIVTADTLWATAVSALMGPIWALRDWDLRRIDNGTITKAEVQDYVATQRMANGGSGSGLAVAGFMAYAATVVVTELLAWWHQKAAWMASEKADAEGMLLLKDPRSMLSALQYVLDRNNHVPTAGDAYSQLFYCWAGFGFAPEDDPEFQRVARLREVLGAEGLAYHPRPNVPDWSTPPPPPRLDDDGGGRR